MTSRKAKVAIALSSILAMAGAFALWLAHAPPAPLRLVFLTTSNDVATGTCWGVFRLENRATNHLAVASGQFLQRAGIGWIKVAGNYDPRPGAASLSTPLVAGDLGPLPGPPSLTSPLVARGSYTFRTEVPSEAGSYRLELEVVPCVDIRDVGKPSAQSKTLRYRIAIFLLQHGLLPQRFQRGLLNNASVLQSQPFQPGEAPRKASSSTP